MLAALVSLAGGACGGGEDPPEPDGALLDAATDAFVIDAVAQCPATYAACATYEDRTTATLVDIVASEESYTPPCIRVRAGTQVRIQADAEHPLYAASCSPDDFVGAPAGGALSTATYTMSSAGTFGYYCPAHGTSGGAGMAGAILVVE